MGDRKPAYTVDRPAAVEHDGCDEGSLPPWVHKPRRHAGHDHACHCHNKDGGCEDSANKDKALKLAYFLDTFFLLGILLVNRGAGTVRFRRVYGVCAACIIYVAYVICAGLPGGGIRTFPGVSACTFLSGNCVFLSGGIRVSPICTFP